MNVVKERAQHFLHMARHLPVHIASFTFAFLFIQDTAFAQAAPVWQVSPGGAVQWIRTTSTGGLLACTSEGLKGVDPSNGAITWTLKELANAPEAGYEEIASTPFIAMAPAGAADELVVLEPFGGQVLFSSKASGIDHIASKYFLYPNNAIIVVGQDAGKKAVMACVDMGTGKVRWTKDDAFSKLTSCTSAGKDAILLSTLFFAYKLDANTGAERWKQSPDPKFAGMSALMGMLDKGGANLKGPAGQTQGLFVTTPNAPELCFMALQQTKQTEKTDSQGKTTTTISYSTFVNAFDINDGSYAWAQPLVMQQQLGTIVPIKQGLLVGAADNNGADLLDYKTGKGLWGKNGKGIKVSGPLTSAVDLGDNVLLASGEKDCAVMLVDATGAEVWEKKVKLDGGIAKVIRAGNAWLVASTEEMQVVNPATGTPLLEKPFKGGGELVAASGDELYLFNNKDHLLYHLAPGGTAKPVGQTPLEFEGKEQATHLEMLPEGFVVSSEQNIALIGTDGAIRYRKYYPAPRESGLMRALLYMNAVRAAYYTAAFGYTSAAFGSVSRNIQVTDAGSAAGKEITGQLASMYGDASSTALGFTQQFLARANARFKASTSTDATRYIVSDAGKREFVLVRVNKKDGSLAETIMLGKDKTPAYEVDGFDGTVYLVNGANIAAYR